MLIQFVVHVNKYMNVNVIKTRKFLPPRDDMWNLIKESIKEVRENSVICITSKVVSIGEGRCIPKKEVADKDALVIKQSDMYLPRADWHHRLHTITNGILVGSSGVDESNANDHYILWPEDPDQSAKNIWNFLRRTYKLKNVGVILTDSNAVPLKRGIVGHTIAFWGFSHLRNYVGQKDIFGRKLKFSRSNIPDSLAAFAVYLMGEGNEQTPIVIFEDLPNLKFTSKSHQHESKRFSSWKVPVSEDLFRPFLQSVKWHKNK